MCQDTGCERADDPDHSDDQGARGRRHGQNVPEQPLLGSTLPLEGRIGAVSRRCPGSSGATRLPPGQAQSL